MTRTGSWVRWVALLAVAACGGRGETRAGGDTAVRAGDTGAAAAPNGCGGDRAPAVVGPGFVGPVRVGGRLADLPAACAVRDTSYTRGEGMTERGWVAELPGGGSVVVETRGAARDSAVTRVFVRTERARTDGGVGVGSSLAELRRAHGEGCAVAGEGRAVLGARALPGVSFVSDAPLTGGSPPTPPESARIVEIILTDPAAPLCN